MPVDLRCKAAHDDVNMVWSVLRLPRKRGNFIRSHRWGWIIGAGDWCGSPLSGFPVAHFPGGSCVSSGGEALPCGRCCANWRFRADAGGVVPACNPPDRLDLLQPQSCLCRSSCCHHSPSVLQGLKVTELASSTRFPRHELPLWLLLCLCAFLP